MIGSSEEYGAVFHFQGGADSLVARLLTAKVLQSIRSQAHGTWVKEL